MGKWYKGTVLRGKKLGRKLGFPTINLNPELFPINKTHGVYACRVNIKDKLYGGALYFGPRLVLNENKNVLEIFVLDFQEEIYGEKISFQIVDYLRKPLNFTSQDSLKLQLAKDIRLVKTRLGMR